MGWFGLSLLVVNEVGMLPLLTSLSDTPVSSEGESRDGYESVQQTQIRWCSVRDSEKVTHRLATVERFTS